MHIGTINITANGNVSDSYCAASTRNTNTTAMPNTSAELLPAAFSW